MPADFDVQKIIQAKPLMEKLERYFLGHLSGVRDPFSNSRQYHSDAHPVHLRGVETFLNTYLMAFRRIASFDEPAKAEEQMDWERRINRIPSASDLSSHLSDVHFLLTVHAETAIRNEAREGKTQLRSEYKDIYNTLGLFAETLGLSDAKDFYSTSTEWHWKRLKQTMVQTDTNCPGIVSEHLERRIKAHPEIAEAAKPHLELLNVLKRSLDNDRFEAVNIKDAMDAFQYAGDDKELFLSATPKHMKTVMALYEICGALHMRQHWFRNSVTPIKPTHGLLYREEMPYQDVPLNAEDLAPFARDGALREHIDLCRQLVAAHANCYGNKPIMRHALETFTKIENVPDNELAPHLAQISRAEVRYAFAAAYFASTRLDEMRMQLQDDVWEKVQDRSELISRMCSVAHWLNIESFFLMSSGAQMTDMDSGEYLPQAVVRRMSGASELNSDFRNVWSTLSIHSERYKNPDVMRAFAYAEEMRQKLEAEPPVTDIKYDKSAWRFMLAMAVMAQDGMQENAKHDGELQKLIRYHRDGFDPVNILKDIRELASETGISLFLADYEVTRKQEAALRQHSRAMEPDVSNSFSNDRGV